MMVCIKWEPVKIYIDDRAGINMFNIRSKARKMVNKHGVRVIIIDYLQHYYWGRQVVCKGAGDF